MAAAKISMEYTGDEPLDVTLPGTGVVQLVKGDKVDWEEYGGKAFFEGRPDFKVWKKPSRAAGKSKPKPKPKGEGDVGE